MEGSVEISDGFLINNLYRILYNEYGESGFKDIFEEIGISSDIEKGDIGDEQVKRIQEWIAKQDEKQNKLIKLIGLLEDFRKVSDNENEFDRQMEIAEKIYEPLIEVIAKRMLRGTNQYNNYRQILNVLKKTQDHVFITKEFKRDNIIHQIRVFLLGCYVLYEDKEFWIKQIQEDKYNYKQCVYLEAQKQGYQKIDSRVATDAVIKQCEATLAKIRTTFSNEGVPEIIIDRFLKKTRVDMTRKILQSLMFAEASRKAGATQ